MRMQPEDTLVPMVQGSLEPWMRYNEEPRYIARAPSGFCGPPSMCRGRSGRRASISGGGVHAGHSFFAEICLTPDQVNPGRPTPMPYRIALPFSCTRYRNLLGVSTTIVPAPSLP